MLNKVIEIAIRAGREILNVYNNEEFNIEIKGDDSPLTKADLVANRVICEGLKEISEYPINSEESSVEFETRKCWRTFWLVDPLDGTKDFIAKNDEFTINIALIKENHPVLGVIHIPATGLTYYAEKGKGAFKDGKKISNLSDRTFLIGSDSNFHSSEETQQFFLKYKIENIKKYGSAIKFCKLAEGEIDIYPRLNGTKEWDTAAGHIIANEAGCSLIDLITKKEIVYNKESIKNNFFIALRNNLKNIIE